MADVVTGPLYSVGVLLNVWAGACFVWAGLLWADGEKGGAGGLFVLGVTFALVGASLSVPSLAGAPL